jgi:hypothetical protein
MRLCGLDTTDGLLDRRSKITPELDTIYRQVNFRPIRFSFLHARTVQSAVLVYNWNVSAIVVTFSQEKLVRDE